MSKVYIIILCCCLIVSAYLYGVNITNAKCRMRVAQETLQKIENQQKQILQNKRVLHDKVYKTGTVDIRRILQSKYTIAE